MRKVVLFLHTSLDGFVAGPNGEMEWINTSEELFDYAAQRTEEADTALYGRVTYQMMEGYWPTAGELPDATKHDIEHSQWYNRVEKVVLSRSMTERELPNARVIGDNVAEEITKLKQQEGKNIVIFGSPTASHSLMAENLIDDYWLFVNPVLLGAGIPVFKDIRAQTALRLSSSHVFPSGVVGLHYTVAQ